MGKVFYVNFKRKRAGQNSTSQESSYLAATVNINTQGWNESEQESIKNPVAGSFQD